MLKYKDVVNFVKRDQIMLVYLSVLDVSKVCVWRLLHLGIRFMIELFDIKLLILL